MVEQINACIQLVCKNMRDNRLHCKIFMVKQRNDKLQTLNSDKLVGITVCPCIGSQDGTFLIQQLLTNFLEGFGPLCFGIILNNKP